MNPAPATAEAQAPVRHRGLVFTDESILDLLAGTKTQTRRLVHVPKMCSKCKAPTDRSGSTWWVGASDDASFPGAITGAASWVLIQPCGKCRTTVRVKPPIVVGDVVYAKEAWQVTPADMGGRTHTCWYRPDNAQVKHDGWSATGKKGLHICGASDLSDYDDPDWYGRWRSPLMMPLAAARLFFDVVAVRAGRIQLIEEADAIAEGVKPGASSTAVDAFRRRWDALHSKNGSGWERNDVVWAYTLRRRTT